VLRTSSYIAETSSSQPADEAQDRFSSLSRRIDPFRGTLSAYVRSHVYVTRACCHCLADTFHSATERMSFCYIVCLGGRVPWTSHATASMANATSRSGHGSDSACNSTLQYGTNFEDDPNAGLSSVHRGCVWMYVLLSIEANSVQLVATSPYTICHAPKILCSAQDPTHICSDLECWRPSLCRLPLGNIIPYDR
jgi:hypothetical protein